MLGYSGMRWAGSVSKRSILFSPKRFHIPRTLQRPGGVTRTMMPKWRSQKIGKGQRNRAQHFGCVIGNSLQAIKERILSYFLEMAQHGFFYSIRLVILSLLFVGTNH